MTYEQIAHIRKLSKERAAAEMREEAIRASAERILLAFCGAKLFLQTYADTTNHIIVGSCIELAATLYDYKIPEL